jgi:hypothetical protein
VVESPIELLVEKRKQHQRSGLERAGRTMMVLMVLMVLLLLLLLDDLMDLLLLFLLDDLLLLMVLLVDPSSILWNV